jgi:hypothetical protein
MKDQNEDVSATDRKLDFTFPSRDKKAASKFLRRTKRSAYEECREGCWFEEMYEIYENYERSVSITRHKPKLFHMKRNKKKCF